MNLTNAQQFDMPTHSGKPHFEDNCVHGIIPPHDR